MFIDDKFFEIRPNENLLRAIDDSSALRFETSFFWGCDCNVKKWIERGGRINSVDVCYHSGIVKFNNDVFYYNLLLVDSALAEIYFWITFIAHCYESIFIEDIANALERIDPLNLYDSSLDGFDFYRIKLKYLLQHIVYGMNSYNVWKGELDYNRIIRIFLREQVIVFNAYQRGSLSEFLMSNVNVDVFRSTESSGDGKVFLTPSFYLKESLG